MPRPFPPRHAIPFGETETWTSAITIGEIEQIEDSGPVAQRLTEERPRYGNRTPWRRWQQRHTVGGP